MITPLRDSGRAQCGGKAATLSLLMRAGLPVPDGFVVHGDTSVHTEHQCVSEIDEELKTSASRALERLGHPTVAVRSSAMTEDGRDASAAGQYESVLGVRGLSEVHDAIIACRASAHARRVRDYLNRMTRGVPVESSTPAVIVQRHVPAEVSGVMFTAGAVGGVTRIEASWGLGVAVVSGAITPDSYEVLPGGTVRVSLGQKGTRVDADPARSGVVARTVSGDHRTARTLTDERARSLAALGVRIADLIGGPQDVEWAISDDEIWILQARPVTAPLPHVPAPSHVAAPSTLRGAAGSHGVVTAQARVVRGPADFGSVRPGEVIVCPITDPAWTPLFAVAAGIITEAGGALSHAAIVAREYGIPAALGVVGALERIRDGDRVTLDGSEGTIVLA